MNEKNTQQPFYERAWFRNTLSAVLAVIASIVTAIILSK